MCRVSRADALSFPSVSQTALHVGYIPLIIYLGMTTTEPRPSLAQLLGPM